MRDVINNTVLEAAIIWISWVYDKIIIKTGKIKDGNNINFT